MKKGVIAFLLSFVIFSCGKNQDINVKTDLEKRNLRGQVKSYSITQIVYNNKPKRYFINSTNFNRNGFVTKEISVNDLDSVVVKHYYNEAFLLDSTRYYRFNTYGENAPSLYAIKRYGQSWLL